MTTATRLPADELAALHIMGARAGEARPLANERVRRVVWLSSDSGRFDTVHVLFEVRGAGRDHGHRQVILWLVAGRDDQALEVIDVLSYRRPTPEQSRKGGATDGLVMTGATLPPARTDWIERERPVVDLPPAVYPRAAPVRLPLDPGPLATMMRRGDDPAALWGRLVADHGRSAALPVYTEAVSRFITRPHLRDA